MNIHFGQYRLTIEIHFREIIDSIRHQYRHRRWVHVDRENRLLLCTLCNEVLTDTPPILAIELFKKEKTCQE